MEPRGISSHSVSGHQPDDAQIKRKRLLPEDGHTNGAAYMAAMPNSIWMANKVQA